MTANPPFRTIQLQRDTAANWTSANTLLAEGELGLEMDTRKAKIGDWVTNWNSLSYAFWWVGGWDMFKSENLSWLIDYVTARTNIWLWTSDSPQFAGVNVGHASDTTFAREASGVYSAGWEIMNGFTSTATAAGTTTLTKASTKIQQFTGTTTQTVVLPTTGIIKGQQYIVQNIGTAQTAMLTVQSSWGNEIAKIGYGCTVVFTSTQATPYTAAHWTFQKFGTNVITATSYTTDTGTSLNCDYWDIFEVTAQAGALKLNNPTGSPRNWQVLYIPITATWAHALTHDTQFQASTVALPTVLSTARLNNIYVWSASTSKWVIVSSV